MSESDLFRIEEIPGMGLGVITLKDIPKRTLILKESPQFVVHGMWDKFGNVNAFDPKLMSSFNRMVKDDQKEFLNLRSDREAPFELLKIFNIYDANKFTNKGFTPSGLADTEIVCLKVSRFNHSCRSNAFYDIDWDKRNSGHKDNLSMEIKASKDIKAGQEITICYKGGGCSMRKFRTRQEMLKFNCICKVCKNGPAEDKADFDEYEKLMQDNKNLVTDASLDFQTKCMRLVDCHKKAYNLGKKNKASPSLLYDRLSAGFLYSACGFRDYKKSEFKGNAMNFAVAGKKLQELFGFIVPEKGEWQKRIDFDKWIKKKDSNKWLDQHEKPAEDE